MYKIVRHFFSKRSRTIKSGLTLEEARRHCNNPETSSSTATGPYARRISKRANGDRWFDGYEET